MKDKKKRTPKELEDVIIGEEIERKYFPKSHEREKREKTMKDPELFEKDLKDKLRKCLIKE